MLLTYIHEVLGSYLSQDTNYSEGFHGFPQALQKKFQESILT
jgi:hypothetical protein